MGRPKTNRMMRNEIAKADNIPTFVAQLVKRMNEGNAEVKERCAMGLRNVGTQNHGEHAETLFKAGAVKPLVELLRTGTSDAQGDAAGALAAIASKADGSARRHQEPCRQRRHSFSDPTQLPSFAAGPSEVCIPSASASAVASVAGDTSGVRTSSFAAHDPAGAPADKRGAKTKLDSPLRPQRPPHPRLDSGAASRRARVSLLPQ